MVRREKVGRHNRHYEKVQGVGEDAMLGEMKGLSGTLGSPVQYIQMLPRDWCRVAEASYEWVVPWRAICRMVGEGGCKETF
jgi:hypothetical protein